MVPNEGLDRRRALFGVAAVGVGLPVLAACGGDDDSSDTPADAADTPADTPSGSQSAGATLARTSDVEVGGAVFLAEEESGGVSSAGVVITQPAAGEFHAFDRTCTHQMCPVTDIRNGQIHCDCHQSFYSMTTGDNESGPAPSPLTELEITVENDTISLA